MANDYTANPIYLDTFSSAIDVGNSLFADSNAQICVEKIKWINGTATHTALISDADDNVVFKDTAETNNVSRDLDLNGLWFKGLKIAASGVGSGQILIYMR